jgi:hypothetical protein
MPLHCCGLCANSMKLQAELERLIRAEAQRTEQENFDWACGMVVGVIVLVGFALFILIAMGAGH